MGIAYPFRHLPGAWRRLGLARRRPSAKALEREPTLRSELFNAEQMERYGAQLAQQHRPSAHAGTDALLSRLADNVRTLADIQKKLAATMPSRGRAMPAAEWLLDNYYLIEDHIRMAQKHLPKGYSRMLRQLDNSSSAGLPLVYDIALEIISHGDGRVEDEELRRFIAAYQTVNPLTLGELWAIPIMLRLALIENVRRVAARTMVSWNDRNLATAWAERMIATAESDPKSIVLVVADMAHAAPPMSGPFVAEMVRRLQGQSTALTLPLTWIEQLLSESGQGIAQLVQVEAQHQAAEQVAIRNSIGSLRLLEATDWPEFVESLSIVEHVLQEDPAGIYAAMDFSTRDDYRHVVERLARASGRSEEEVARAATALSAQRAAAAPAAVEAHVGYYLVGRGLPVLERDLAARRGLADSCRRTWERAPLAIYLGLAAVLALLLASIFLAIADKDGWPVWAWALLALPVLVLTSVPAIGLVNRLVTATMIPRILPRMDYAEGVPRDGRTLVVVPTLIGSIADIDELIEGLEIRFLANRDAHLHFGLLTDFKDAASETLPHDAMLLSHARAQVEDLNRRYADAGRFFLFHRPRRWNPAERTWMGYERKRGKLNELNALLRGRGGDRFSLVVGDTAVLPQVRYVITLDTDTQLPRDAARQFVGAMAHPLNRAVYDPQQCRVVAGHAILQPRVGISLGSTSRSRYAKLFGSDAGMDPYTRAVSDVYQDLFDEGSFIGKGIYDVDAFEQAIAGRLPDGRVLSHDLIEGCYARSGLLSDVLLYEEHPAHYSTGVQRRHRWIRGDWQLLPWVLPWTRAAQGGVERNPLSALSRWKLLDNLRRSLEPVAMLAMLAVGWLWGSHALAWTVAVLAMLFLLPVLAAMGELARKPADVTWLRHVASAWRPAGEHLGRALLALVWLPHEALDNLDAIVRTLWRMGVSRRRLLQWNASREVALGSVSHLSGLLRLMWIGPVLSIAFAAALFPYPAVLACAAPLLGCWLLSPLVAWWISRPPPQAAFAPSVAERRFLQALARRTWAYFDDYVSADDHWLPPDNVQEHPDLVVAHRTSPTNMGMALLAQLAAYDLGHLGGGGLLERLARTMDSMAGLARHRGHFYNWYDTRSLEPLAPRYVSTVDSGNLVGHLLTLRPGLVALADDPPFAPRQLEALAITVWVLSDALRAAGIAIDELEVLHVQLERAQATPPASLPAASACLAAVLAEVERLAGSLAATATGDAAFWLQALLAQCREQAAGLACVAVPPLASAAAGDGGLPSWRKLARLDPGQWPAAEQAAVAAARSHAAGQLATASRLADLAGELAAAEFGFLYDRRRDLFSIGYNVDNNLLDDSYYDLLASEARLASFVAIAQGQLPQRGWFALGRLLTGSGGEPVLLSWSGSLFEYLMPMLVMPSYAGTLLDQTCSAAVARQIAYGHRLGLPWGVSESGYNAVGADLSYQYRAFGVPGLGIKRGLGEDAVVAPYASVLALMVAPQEACRNLLRLAAAGLAGRYGLYEAVDYTKARLPRGQTSAVIRSYMAHHQGMSLSALDNLLMDRPMQRRFASDPQCQATLLLLQERVAKSASEYLHAAGIPGPPDALHVADSGLRVITDPDRATPAVQLLSNGRYHVMVSHAGGGYSRRGEMAVTRWREDATCDHWGMFCYVRDVAGGDFWSTAPQPVMHRPERYEAIFSDARVEFRVRMHGFDTHTEIAVSPEDDIELRRIHVTSHARTRRTIEFTSYAEVVLAPAMADAMQPAFSNLFVQTELVPSLQAIVCTRRPRAGEEAVPWMCHLLAVHGAHVEAVSYETDRARFIGRGRSLRDPAAMDTAGEGLLSNSAGSVLDPIVAIRCRLTLEPGQSATVDLVTGVGDSREACMQLIGKYRDRYLADRVFDLAWTHNQIQLRQINASLGDARLYEEMAASLIYANAAMRAEPGVLAASRRDQSGLWGQSISGDRPIVLLQIADGANIEMVRQLVQAHAYWRLKGLVVDLVIWNEDHAGYRQQLQEAILSLISSEIDAHLLDRPGGIYVRPGQQLSREDRLLIQSVARIVLADSRGSLAEQVQRRRPRVPLPAFEPSLPAHAVAAVASAPAATELQLGNPYGGFSADGSEYLIVTSAQQATPAPWVNVLANAQFGTVVSESGSAYSWNENAHEFRLTPWSNDAVRDAGGEALYLRDEETGHYWSPTPLPRRGSGDYLCRHGFGYSVFEHVEDGIRSELWVYVALDAPVKFSVLKLFNQSGRPRRLSVTGYVEWVLGDLREKSAMHVVTELDPASGAMLARNPYLLGFAGRVAFFDVDAPDCTASGDRGEFIGRNGSLAAPAAMAQARLSGRTGAGLDPCGALQTELSLGDGDSGEVVFLLGAASDAGEAGRLAQRFRGSVAAADALEALRTHWRWVLDKIRIETPDPALDVLANGWLMYQVIACRFWARSGYYQSGGAFGFRDQLQDSMAMLHAAPYAARQHLLLCAAHQFTEGDVQHWWHPPQDRGVRTRCSDDYLWLALAVSRYVEVTGDAAVLDESVKYIDGRPLNPGEEAYYDLPGQAPLSETLYRHCVRALEHAASRGVHGLPLIGSGDWNDGMNLVGEQGRGESVWLGFFLCEVLQRFAVVARGHGDEAYAEHCEQQAAALKVQLELHGWDGAWYRRAYFDDGTPLGSAGGEECRIDSIAQSWAVLSGAAPDARRRTAMDSLDRHLVRRDLGLVQLLDPPFERSMPDPGYIKGYLPGVRENGGQYTHAAVWAAMAFAELGDGARAWELLDMINPVRHGDSAAAIDTYKIEPYVMAADVYSVAPHAGRGGWSWYTGSAGWMYRLIVESLLGLQLRGESLRIRPLLPADWPSFTIHYRFRETDYHISVRRHPGAEAAMRVAVDGVEQDGEAVELADDGVDHYVDVAVPRGA